MRAKKIDDNQREIVSALRRCGAIVQSLASVGDGVPDLLVGYKRQTYLIEVKDGSKPPSARQLTHDQILWHVEWCGGPLCVVHNVDEALAAIGAI